MTRLPDAPTDHPELGTHPQQAAVPEGLSPAPLRHPERKLLAVVPPNESGGERDALAAAVIDVAHRSGYPASSAGGRSQRSRSALVTALTDAFSAGVTDVALFSPSLVAPLAAAMAASRTRPSVTLFAGGADAGLVGPITARMMRRLGVRVVATDSSSGAAFAARVEDVVVGRPGVDAEVFHRLLELPPSPEPSSDNQPVIVTFSSPEGGPGVRHVLAAADQVRAAHAGLEVLVLSNAGPRGELARMVADRAEWVSVLASTALEDVAAALARAHLAVFGGRAEATDAGGAFGIPAMLAQIASVPVVIPSAGVPGDVVVEGVTGLRAAAATSEAIAVAAVTILGDTTVLQRMTSNARMWALETFSPHRFEQAVKQGVLGVQPEPARVSPLVFVHPVT